MSAPYDLSFTNSTNPLIDGGTAVNSATGGILGLAVCLIVYFIIIKSATENNYGIGRALLAASAILSVVAGILLGLGWLPDYVLGVNIVIFITSIFITLFGEK